MYSLQSAESGKEGGNERWYVDGATIQSKMFLIIVEDVDGISVTTA
jgi:hypothetical protein